MKTSALLSTLIITVLVSSILGFYLGQRNEALYGPRIDLVDCGLVITNDNEIGPIDVSHLFITGHEYGICVLGSSTAYRFHDSEFR